MLTWGQAQDFTASLFGAPDWSRLDAANQRLATSAINAAIDKCWSSVAPSFKVKNGVLRLRSPITITVSGSAGDSSFLTTNSPDGYWQGQHLQVGENNYEITWVEYGGGQWMLGVQEGVHEDWTGAAELSFNFYLLPHDFDGFDEIPTTFRPWSPGEGTGQAIEQDLVLDPRSYFHYYIPVTGQVDVVWDDAARVGTLTGVNTLWTSALVGSMIKAAGRLWVIRRVDESTQTAWSYTVHADDRGAEPLDGRYDYDLQLRGRRAVNVYLASDTVFHYLYRAMAPKDGLDREEIPIPHEPAIRLWIQHFWSMTSDTGSQLSTAQEKQMLRAEAEIALVELAKATRDFSGGPGHIQPSGLHPANRPPRDPRQVTYGATTNNPNFPFSWPDRRAGGRQRAGR